MRALSADSMVTITEDWRRGRHTVRLSWDGLRPETVSKVADCLESLATASGEEDLVVATEGDLTIARPALIRALGLGDRVATLFLSLDGLEEALRAEAMFRGTAFLDCLDQTAREGTRIALLWDEPAFRIGRTLVCPLSRAAEDLTLPAPSPLPEAMTPEAIRRLVVPLANEALPRPDLLLPVTPPTSGEAGPAFRLLRCVAAAHAIGTLAEELRSDGRVLLSGGRSRQIRLTLEDADLAHAEALERTALWVFNNDQTLRERHSVAGRELSERVGLVVDEDRPMLAAILAKVAALDKAVEKNYETYIQGKLDAFFESQRALIEQVRSLSEAFATKARGLVTGLARDALAGTVLTALVSLRILGTSDQASAVPDSVFAIIAVLVVAVGALQLISTYVDFDLTQDEFDRWIKHADFLLPADQRKTLVEEPKRHRVRVVQRTMIVVGICYLVLGFGIANFKAFIVAT